MINVYFRTGGMRVGDVTGMSLRKGFPAMVFVCHFISEPAENYLPRD